jgi:DNA ligase-1
LTHLQTLAEIDSMIRHKTLYARTSTGAVQVWYMEQDGEKYRSVSGQKNGAMVESGWTVALPTNAGKKNANSAEKQAGIEIKNKYKKQTTLNGYWENEADIDQQRYFECMLADKYKDRKGIIDWSLPGGVGVQIKYNGARCIATKDGLFTRKGKKYMSVPHIEDALKPFFAKFPDAILDGELFNWELRQNLKELISLINKKVHITAQDLEDSKKKVRFYIYDGFGFGAEADDGYGKRKMAIDHAFFSDQFKWRYEKILAHVPTYIVHSEADLEAQYKKFVDDKQEGAIIRIFGKPYESKRSKWLLKYKPVDDAEYKILTVNQGKVPGQCETVTVQRIDGLKFLDGTDTFDANFKGTDAEAKAFLADHTGFIGKVVTIYYNGLTGYGKPNFAQFDINNYDKGDR